MERKNMTWFDLDLELDKQIKIIKNANKSIREIKKYHCLLGIKYIEKSIGCGKELIAWEKKSIKNYELKIKEYKQNLIDFKGLPTHIKIAKTNLEESRYNLIMVKLKITKWEKKLKIYKKHLKIYKKRLKKIGGKNERI